jgi:hypothetical protein
VEWEKQEEDEENKDEEGKPNLMLSGKAAQKLLFEICPNASQ